MYFYLKEPKTDKPTLIYLIYYVNAEKKNFKYSTGQKINPTEWDFDMRSPKLKRGASGKKNKQVSLILDKYKNLLENTTFEFEKNNKSLSKDYLKNIFDLEFKPNVRHLEIIEKGLPNNITDAIDLFIEKKLESGGVTKNWENKFLNLKNKVLLFGVYKKVEYTFEDLNENWLGSYCGFLRNYKKLVDKQKVKELEIPTNKTFVGYNDNSLHRHIKLLLTFLTWVKDNYKLDIPNLKNPVKDFETDDVHLTDEEIEKIENVTLDRPSLQRVRDIFLIGVYSGQRFSDYSVFEQADIQGDMIIKRSEKTETKSFIPLHTKLKKLLDKYDWKIPKISGQKFNPHIKEICEIAEINSKVKVTNYRGANKNVEYKEKWEMISSHTARRTFITLSSEKGMPDHIIMAITGIRDVKTLTKYKKTNQATVKDFMNKIWG